MISPLKYYPEAITSDSDNTTAAEYLIALAMSAYRYHIDDDPHDTIWEVAITPEEIGRLDDCTNAAVKRMGNELAWIVYGAAVNVNTDNQFYF